MVFPNLEAEMKRFGYTRADIARALDIQVNSAYGLLSGKRTLSIYRAMKIRDRLFPGKTIDYLFENEL